MDPLVNITEFQTWLGATLDETDAARAGVVLTIASSLVRSEAGLTWEGVVVPDEVKAVVLQVAQRVYQNPDAIRSESVGSYSVSYADAQAAGLWLTDPEKRILARFRTQQRGLWTQQVTRGAEYDTTVWVPTLPTGDDPGPMFPFLSESDL